MRRRKTLALLLMASAALAVSPAARASEDDEALARAKTVLRSAPVADGHNDLPWVIREKFGGDAEGYDISVRKELDTDIPRLREGMVGTQFWSVYVPTSLPPLEAMTAQLEQTDIARRMIALYPEDLAFATSVSDIEEAHQQGRIASLLGMEGGHTLGNSLGALRADYSLGVRYMTLTHYHSNDWADSATDEARHDGLSDFGVEVVREMNRLGMMIDLSHVSVATMLDALDATEAPVIYSHSSARELAGHARNVPDSVLRRMSENGGVVMAPFIPSFVLDARREWEEGMMPLLVDAETDADWERIGKAYRAEHGAPPLASLTDVADHIEHMARVAGVDHVGIGADFYGATGDELVVGLEDVSKYPDLFAELVRRGWSDEDLAKLSQGNVLRVMAQVEAIAARLQKERPPSLARIGDSSAGGSAGATAATGGGEPIFIEGLGALAFPNSGSDEAQGAFRRGVLLLHSFEYDPAAAAFREAQEVDPDFALAYWGEAMTHNHPLWRDHDHDQGVAALDKLAPTAAERRAKAATAREKMYLDAVEALYSEEHADGAAKTERDRAYMEALELLHQAYPEDDEARAFYALSILGSVDGNRDFATYMRAAATVQPVFERNPRHPGAAHYLIHSFDDPIHAPLGLPAADVYAEVAPNAAHAQHMTSHIFVALGLWERVVAANIRATDTQNAQRAEQGERPNVCGHYPAWLHYGYLQLGQVEKAEALMDRCHERALDEPNGSEWQYFAEMRARQVVDLRDWKSAERWTVPLEDLPAEQLWGEGFPGAGFTYRVIDALAQLELGDEEAARALTAERRPEDAMAALQIDQLAGLLALRHGHTDEGLALLRSAAEAEEALPFQFGPPVPVKPTWELLGEALARAGRKEEAAEAFRKAVQRTPGRTLAVEGLERTLAE